MSYEGIQYRYMAPSVLTDKELAYLEQNLRILSGFYGIFPVIHVEITLSAQHKVNGIIPPDTRTIGLFWCTFFPAAGNKMKFF